MSDFRIEKLRVPVTLTTSTGERMDGEIFVQTSARHRSGPEDPADVLNDADAWLPFLTAEGDTVLVAKAQIAEVEVNGDAPGSEDAVEGEDEHETTPGIRAATVSLRLAFGAVRVGSIDMEVARGRPRLLDYLNRLAHPFIVLRGASSCRLINRQMIEHVRPLD
ncbi:MAG: hypothetical protein NVS4B3_09120 [Gemmatimonadaceae bacterium]